MHWMLSGEPLFTGAPSDILAAHENRLPSESIDAKLRRALGKDPRMRPMMLKQFLQDIAQMGGVEPPKLAARVSAPMIGVGGPKAPPIAAPKPPDAAVSRPSSRGWTMFMKAQDDEAEAKPAEPAPPPSKPSTRGWTMFMKAQDDDAAPAETPSPAAEPAASPAQPQPAEPEAAPEGAPSTRGWTMFMKPDEAGGDGANAGADPGEDADASPPADEGTPSTRGWTMFTKDEEAPDEDEAARGDADDGGAAAAQPVPPETSPSTRGWTMFTKDEEGDEGSDEADEAAEGGRFRRGTCSGGTDPPRSGRRCPEFPRMDHVHGARGEAG